MLNEDYRDILLAFSEENVDFLLVGAYAMAAHGYIRATLDIDLWIMPSPRNAEAVMRALQKFGAPPESLTQDDLVSEDLIFQIGVAPRRIDIITSVSGLQFEEAYGRSSPVDIEDIVVRIPALGDLVTNKRSTGRTKDLADAEALEQLQSDTNNAVDSPN